MIFAATGDNMHALPLLRQALEMDDGNAQAKELLTRLASPEE